jgi:Holliday junction resolvase RusA-like endonuclease
MLAARRTPAAIAYAAALKGPARAKRPPAKPVPPPWPFVDSIRIALPLPPSVNGLNFNAPGKGRARTAVYNQWRKDAGWIVQTTKPGRIVGCYEFTLYVPEKTRADVDARTKAALDLFVSLAVTDDDRHCRRALAEKSAAIPKGECLVVIKPCEAV